MRYTLSAGFLDLFKDRSDIRIVILTSITDPKFRKEFVSSQVEVETIPMRDGREERIEKLVRQIRNYLGGIGQNIATFEAKAKMRGRAFWFGYKFLTILFRPFVFFRSWLRWVDYHIISYFTDKQYEILFAKYKPDLVVVHSVQELTAVPVARVAVRKKIRTLGIVLSWDNLTNKGEVYARCDQLVVWNDIMKDQAVRYHGYNPDNVFVQGTPQFDYYIRLGNKIESREDFFKRKGLDPRKKLIVYTTVPERIGGRMELEMIEHIWQGIRLGDVADAQLLVRVYTKDNIQRYEKFINRSDLTLDSPGEKLLTISGYVEQDEYFFKDLAATLKYAGVVVNLASTITIDAAVLGTPVVNWSIGTTGFWYETGHYLSLGDTGGARRVMSETDVTAAIKEYLRDPAKDIVGRKELVKRLCGFVDGQSSLDRLYNTILTILDGHV